MCNDIQTRQYGFLISDVPFIVLAVVGSHHHKLRRHQYHYHHKHFGELISKILIANSIFIWEDGMGL